MSEIKTWDAWLDEFPDGRVVTALDVREAMAREIFDLRAALAKAEGERDAIQLRYDELMRNALDVADENKAFYAKLTALEGQEPVAWINYKVMLDENANLAGHESGTVSFIRLSCGYDWNKSKPLYAAAGAAPSPMTQDRAEELAHRRCKRYIFIDDVPYQFDAHTLMDFVRDIEKAAAAPAPEGWKLVPVEPTEAMLRHGLCTADSYPNLANARRLLKAYKAMLEAAHNIGVKP